MSNIRFEALKAAFKHKPVEVVEPEGKVKDYFARDVFTREKMKEYIAQEILDQLFDDVDNGRTIHRDIANVVAIGIRKWATEHGATHYTHWFQPLTGGTAEKHDAFFTLKRNRMLPRSRAAVFVIPSRHAVTRRGTPPVLSSSSAIPSVSRRSSWRTRARRWTIKLRLSVRQRLCAMRRVKYARISISRSSMFIRTSAGSRSISWWTKHCITPVRT